MKEGAKVKDRILLQLLQRRLKPDLAPGRLDVPVSIGTPTNAASSPSAVSL